MSLFGVLEVLSETKLHLVSVSGRVMAVIVTYLLAVICFTSACCCIFPRHVYISVPVSGMFIMAR